MTKQVDIQLIKRVVLYYNSLGFGYQTDLRKCEEIAQVLNAEGYSVEPADIVNWVKQGNLVCLHGYPEHIGYRGICKHPDCNRLTAAKGYCYMHYKRYKKYGSADIKHKTGQKRIHTNRICKIDGCDNLAKTCGLCRKHYIRIYKYGDPNVVNKRGRKTGIHWWGKADS